MKPLTAWIFPAGLLKWPLTEKHTQPIRLIITTGASANHLNVPGEKELTGKGVSYCATCDGWFFKDRPVVVIGGGDSALEEALFMTRYASSVTIIHRRNEFRGAALLQQRVRENPHIKLLLNHVVTAIQGDDAVKSLTAQGSSALERKRNCRSRVYSFSSGMSPIRPCSKASCHWMSRGILVIN